MPGLKKKYLKYESYKEQTIEDIFDTTQLQNAIKLAVYTMESTLILNQGNGTFTLKALPVAAQYSPVYGIMVEDYDKDGKQDILLGGNFYQSKPEVGIYDASYGLFLRGSGNNQFESVMPKNSGFFVKGQIRDILTINDQLVIIAKNNNAIQTFKY